MVGCGGPRKNLRKADRELSDGEALRAARLYDSVRRDHPDIPAAWSGSARAWLTLDDGERALTSAEGASARDADGAAVLLARAHVLVGRGATAREALSSAALRDTTLAGPLAEAHLAAGDAAAAESVLGALASPGPWEEALHGWAIWRAGGSDACPAAIDRSRTAGAAADAAEASKPLALAAATLQACDDADSAATFADRARLFRTVEVDELQVPAQRRREAGDVEGSARLLSQAEQFFPDDGYLPRELGVSWLAADEPALAEAALLRALPRYPFEQDPVKHDTVVGGRGIEREERQPLVEDLWRSIAMARAAQGDAAGSAAAHERAALAAEAGHDRWVEVARAWLDARQGGPAEAAARQAIAKDEAPGDAWLVLALAGRQQRDLGKAMGAAREAWKRMPGDIETAEVLADAALATGDADTARRVCETALADPQNRLHPLATRLQALLTQAQ
ncbi:MAG: hypothetical protein H6742_20165 [Alphaproteobacteria bacterium]|nr:hypothetical protein [Alphaproteobacteria bacterium]